MELTATGFKTNLWPAGSWADPAPISEDPKPNSVSEVSKYEQMWSNPQYRTVAPGEQVAAAFLQVAQPPRGSSLIDFGAGTGRGAMQLAILGQLNVQMLDFAGNSLDEYVKSLVGVMPDFNFTQHDLNEPVPFRSEYGFCTDVMEHIPAAEVDRVLTNILDAAKNVFFQISCVDDSCGVLIGETLHLSVHPYRWWAAKLLNHGCVILCSQDLGDSCIFYVTRPLDTFGSFTLP